MVDENVDESIEIHPYEIAFASKVFSIAKRYVPHWTSLSMIQMYRMRNSLSNDVFVLERAEITDQEDAPTKALLRIYGRQMERIISKQHEIELAVKLSVEQLGPKVYLLFHNGRLEEFIVSELVTPELMRQEGIAVKIARKLAKMHHWPSLQQNSEVGNELWTRIEDWFGKVKEAMSELTEEQKRALQGIGFPTEIESCWKSARKKLEHCSSCFVHADLQYGNILISKASKEAVFIDFEYALHAPAQYDIANHWCEWAADYSDPKSALLDWSLMPNREQKRRFIEEYAAEQAAILDLDKFTLECEQFQPVSHLHWALWGLLKCYRDNEFDYFGYALERFRQMRHYE